MKGDFKEAIIRLKFHSAQAPSVFRTKFDREDKPL